MSSYFFEKLQELITPYTFRNWREIMEYVGAPRDLKGNSKVKFQNDVKRYVELHKGNGNEIIIDAVKDKVDTEIILRGSRYQKLIIPLISHLLMTERETCFTINTLAEKIGCVNSYYASANRHKKMVSRVLKIEQENVFWFFESMHDRIKNALLSSLNKMVQENLISYEIKLKGKYHEGGINRELIYSEERDEYFVESELNAKEYYRFLSDDEISIYHLIMTELFEKYQISDESQLYKKNRSIRNKFYDEKKKSIFKRLKYVHTFDTYNITPIGDLETMTDDEFMENKLTLNELISTGFRKRLQDIITKEKEEFHKLCEGVELGLIVPVDEEGTELPMEVLTKFIEENRKKYDYRGEEIELNDRERLVREYIDILFDIVILGQS